jgi:hypothetical protein
MTGCMDPAGQKLGELGGDDIVRTSTWWQRASGGQELAADGVRYRLAQVATAVMMIQ